MSKSKNKRLGVLGTIIFHAVLLGILLLCAFHTPLPLPEEEGILVNFGNTNTGRGNSAPAPAKSVKKSTPKKKKRVVTPPKKRSKKTQIKPNKSKQPKLLTQKTEDAPALPSAEEIARKKAEKEKAAKERAEKIRQQKIAAEKERQERLRQEEERKKQEELERQRQEAAKRQAKIDAINKRAKSAFGKGTSTNASQGKNFPGGNQGNPSGNINSDNYNGTGLGNKGISYSLNGRNSLSIPKPKYNLQESGKVVVEITVDKNGKVVNARPGMSGTTTTSNQLWKAAKNAALKARFNADSKAPAYQQGTITYNFELN